MADVSYAGEVQSILDLLRLRQPAGHLDVDKLPFANIDPDNFAAASSVRRFGRRQVYDNLKRPESNLFPFPHCLQFTYSLCITNRLLRYIIVFNFFCYLTFCTL